MEIRAVNTYVDSKHGVISVDDDVLNVVRDIREISDRLHVFFNSQTEEYDLVESCLDGADRLVFSVKTLDQRTVTRLRQADHWYGRDEPNQILGDDEDYVARVDRHNEETEAEIRRGHLDRVSEAGERIAWALDLVSDAPSVKGSISVPKDPDGTVDPG